jgi:serine/threonine-protein kinase
VIQKLGDLELLKRLGAGAQAEVFLAADPDGQLVAVKLMLEHLTVREEARKAFMREARTSTLLKHPNLVEIYEVAEEDGRPYIAMELVRGWSLSALLKKLRAAGRERLDQDEAAEIVRQAALGLHFAHELKGPGGTPLGLVHRDVSPQNIMVSEEGVAKVVDFGLAKATLTQDTVTQAIKGKLRYMPPEQLRSQAIDRRADVFALGAVLWDLACGTPLHPGASEAEVFQQALYMPQPHPDEVAKGLSRQMVDVLVRATARDPDKRTATAAQLAEALAPMSSPQARDKLVARLMKHFDPLPRTLEEARGGEASTSAPTKPHRPKGRSGVVLPPPPQKVPSYLAPEAAQRGPRPEREESTDSRDGQTVRVAPIEREAPTDASIVPLKDISDTATNLPPDWNDTAVATTSTALPPLQTIDDDDREPTGSSTALRPRKMPLVIGAASLAMIIVGAAIGVLLRGERVHDDFADADPPPGPAAAPTVPGVDDDTLAVAPSPTPHNEVERLFADARSAFKAGNYRLAKTKLERCLRLDKVNPDCHMLLGGTLVQLNDGAGAAKQYELFLKYAPGDHPAIEKVKLLLEQYHQSLH